MALTKAQTEVYKQLEEKRHPVFTLKRAHGNMNTDSDFDLTIKGEILLNRDPLKNKVLLKVNEVKLNEDFDLANMNDAIARCTEIFAMSMVTVKDLVDKAKLALSPEDTKTQPGIL